ncbi:MAG: single-stranded DNA-binding protein [Verrucomicrobiales bacterium]|nr:single-stranded DNA-binding protein [Verrucomicrobiales bacterium]|tara:strand:- start:1290 stop:1736 length:447 start_codon:yes stop_codon:yes gene_type:complete
MPNYNKVILMGNLTRDPEVRYTSGGTAIAKLGLAVNRRWTNKEGQSQEETTFVDVDAFGRQAETIGQYLKKGRPVMVEGRLKLDQWDDKQTGQKRSKLGVVLENFQFLDSRGDSGGGGGGGYSQPDAPSAPAQGAGGGSMPEDDDVPF